MGEGSIFTMKGLKNLEKFGCKYEASDHFVKQTLWAIPVLIMLGFGMPGMAQEQWETVGTDTFSDKPDADFQDIEFKPDTDIPYVSYAEAENPDGFVGLTVKKFNGSQWVSVGAKQFTKEDKDEEGDSYHDLAFSPNAQTPYVAYADEDEDRYGEGASPNLSVAKFDGNQWVHIGRGLAAGIVERQSLAFDGSTPYVAYTDGRTTGPGNNGITCLKYDGNQWKTVGDKKFTSPSTGDAIFPSLAIAPGSGTPYVAYQDRANNAKLTVQKFDGNQWTTVGKAGFSEKRCYLPDLTFPPGSDEPYVAYHNSDSDSEDKIIVQKFNGNQWTSVGQKGFSENEINSANIAFASSSGTPYVGFISEISSSSSSATVKKFNGSQWENVGDQYITGDIQYLNFAISPQSEDLYMAYSDEANGGRTTVKKFTTESPTGNSKLPDPQAGFSLYPNPASDQLTLVQQGNFEPRTLELQTLTGRTVQTGKLQGKGRHTVDVSDVSAGVYLLQVRSDEAVRKKKVVVE